MDIVKRIIYLIAAVVCVFSIVIFILYLWASGKVEDNPHPGMRCTRSHRDDGQALKFSERVARRLMNSPVFLGLADYFGPTAVGMVLVAAPILLFLLTAMGNGG